MFYNDFRTKTYWLIVFGTHSTQNTHRIVVDFFNWTQLIAQLRNPSRILISDTVNWSLNRTSDNRIAECIRIVGAISSNVTAFARSTQAYHLFVRILIEYGFNWRSNAQNEKQANDEFLPAFVILTQQLMCFIKSQAYRYYCLNK